MYKTHRQNHNFQIAYFIAGSCHTPDGAYAILQDLRDDRVAALANYEVSVLRQEAKKISLREIISGSRTTVVQKTNAQADLQEIENNETTGEVLHDAAVDELKFIDKCIAAIQPLRKYAHLPDPESHEAAQKEEWKLELIHRAENSMITTGTVSPADFATMRMHPEFTTEIFPRIKEIQASLKEDSMLGPDKILKLAEERKAPLMLLLQGEANG